MVVTKMRWADDGGEGDDDDDLRLPGAGRRSPSLGILAFEAASTMTKLLSLHRSLSEKEVARLRSNTMRAAGVEYLSSTDQAFLLRLACAEAVAALDAAAAAVARLGARCGLDFAGPYASLKAGAPDARLDQFVAKGLKVKAKRMERLVAATAKLCAEMEALDKLEAAEQRSRSSPDVGGAASACRSPRRPPPPSTRWAPTRSGWVSGRSAPECGGSRRNRSGARATRRPSSSWPAPPARCSSASASSSAPTSPACPRRSLPPKPSTAASPSFCSTQCRRRRSPGRCQGPSNVETCRCASR